MLDIFFDTNDFYLCDKKIEMGLVPQRLRGDNATFDIRIGRKLVVEEGRRITAKHVKDLEKSGAKIVWKSNRKTISKARFLRTTSSMQIPVSCLLLQTTN